MVLDSLGYLDTADGGPEAARAHRAEAASRIRRCGRTGPGRRRGCWRARWPCAAAPTTRWADAARVEAAARAALGARYAEHERCAGSAAGAPEALRELARVTLDG
ncbi:hypothetical protein ADK61_11105 [Streptomyces sp. XY66]|nr:hypothetical protein ADK61_11105 [Streptomyces sp. XY66]